MLRISAWVEAPFPTPFPYETVDNFGKARSGRLSGMVFYPQRKTFFVASDNGRISEIRTGHYGTGRQGVASISSKSRHPPPR